MTTTLAHKLTLILSYGFKAGPRPADVNPGHGGRFLVAQSHFEGFKIVGDDIEELVNEAFDLCMDFDGADVLLAAIQAGG